ncbi:MAG: sigma-54-dependent Fis family transcriptional regulator [Gammaproteobacteria bacterium]|nr:sigma-54-dependent Fis family transcriptional regulator [Gammaproteobacteria bacterium]
MLHALLVDDDADHLMRLAPVFRRQGFSVTTAATYQAASEALLRELPQVVLIDVKVQGGDGITLFENADLANVVDIFLMADEPSVASAVRGMRVGASGYFSKPVDMRELEGALTEYREQHASEAGDEGPSAGARTLLTGSSPAITKFLRMIRKVAATEAAVLLAGESGVGKELAAQTIHARSRRSRGPFVALNCGAITTDLMESELFGHEKGSFTGAARAHKGYFSRAAGGTLFLDEITELPLELQVKLLRVLETRRFFKVGGEKEVEADVRLISSTNRDPANAVRERKLREDLYYRIAQFPVRMPPLRERGEDVIELAREFLAAHVEKTGVEKRFEDQVLELFRLHDWPGNVRELKNVVARAYILAGDAITVDDLPGNIPSGHPTRGDHVRLTIGHSLEDVERRIIFATVEHYAGDKKKAAHALGISLKTLYNRLRKYQLS